MLMNYNRLSEVSADFLSGKRVLVRIDANITVQNGQIVDDYRLRRTLPTIEYLLKAGAKVILLGHREAEGDDSLAVVSEYLAKKHPTAYLPGKITNETKLQIDQAVDSLILLDNVRYNPGEKENTSEFSQLLASLADVFVNEAFSVSHRPHASIVGVPTLLPSYAGFLFDEEVMNLSQSFKPEKPFLFILGGAKFETKLPLVKKYLDLADYVLIGGALANDCYKAKGYPVGVSKVSNENISIQEIIKHEKLLLPPDVEVFNSKQEKRVCLATEVKDDESILDAGPGVIEYLKPYLSRVKTILWNGPLGNYEAGFENATLNLAKEIAQLSGVRTILGGGDTLSAIAALDLTSRFSFVSTGGGAMLDFLANETLPGIKALEQKKTP